MKLYVRTQFCKEVTRNLGETCFYFSSLEEAVKEDLCEFEMRYVLEFELSPECIEEAFRAAFYGGGYNRKLKELLGNPVRIIDLEGIRME